MQDRLSPSRKYAILTLILCGTVLGLAGTDLVLPAIPSLPMFLDGTLREAQLVLATFAAGTAIGLLFFGELGARYPSRWLLAGALLSYGVLSTVATYAQTINELVLIRFVQGFAAAGPAVFAPGMIRALFDEQNALRALGFVGSAEAIAPALAPVLGAWLLVYFDWRASFILTAALALLFGLIWLLANPLLSTSETARTTGGYLNLMKNRTFQRYALSQAFSLGGLLIFVFGAPTVITTSMQGSLTDFVVMQIIGITFFVVSTNLTAQTVARLGRETTIKLGTLMSAGGCVSLLLYGLFGGNRPEMLWVLFVFVNLGFGVRGPPGFYAAILASGQDDARGAALVVLLVLLTTAIGTAIAAPFIELGLVPLSTVATVVSLCAVLVLWRWHEPPEALTQT